MHDSLTWKIVVFVSHTDKGFPVLFFKLKNYSFQKEAITKHSIEGGGKECPLPPPQLIQLSIWEDEKGGRCGFLKDSPSNQFAVLSTTHKVC